MIEIKTTSEKSVYDEFGFDINSIVMAVKDKDEVLGAGSVSIHNGYAILEAISFKEEYKMFNMDFGLGKSLLNLLDLRGVRYVFSDMEDDRLMTALRFKKDFEIPSDIDIGKKYQRFLCLDGYFTVDECE